MQFTQLKYSSFLIIFSITGCQQIDPYQKPKISLSHNYPIQTQHSYQALSWIDYVKDQQLINIVDLALVANQDLKIASLRMHEAQAAYNIQRAELFPNIGGTASMERSHVPADLSYVGREVTSSQYSVGLGMNQWELDLWGRIRSLNEAALQQFLAVESNVRQHAIVLCSKLFKVI